jgi:2-keto-myo-inositol isomerase
MRSLPNRQVKQQASSVIQQWIPCVCQTATLSASFEEDVRGYSEAGCWNLELWLPKLEECLRHTEVDRVIELVADRQVRFPVASLQGGLFQISSWARQEAWNLFRRRLPLCRQLGVETLVIAADFSQAIDASLLRRAVGWLREAAELAAEHRIRLALEFQRRALFCDNLQTALAFVRETAMPNVGICLDAFHFFTGPSKLSDLQELTAELLFHVQLCDVAGVPREWARDADRILPGEGDWELEAIVAHLRAIQYAGPIAVEIRDPNLWRLPPRQVAEVLITSLRRFLGLAQPQPLLEPEDLA